MQKNIAIGNGRMLLSFELVCPTGRAAIRIEVIPGITTSKPACTCSRHYLLTSVQI